MTINYILRSKVKWTLGLPGVEHVGLADGRVEMLLGKAALPHTGDVVGPDAKVGLVGVHAGVAVDLVGRVQAHGLAGVAQPGVGGPGGAARHNDRPGMITIKKVYQNAPKQSITNK